MKYAQAINVGELNSLPANTVVKSGNGVFERWREDDGRTPGPWIRIGVDWEMSIEEGESPFVPATILYIPTKEVTE